MCPDELREATSGMLYAASRCGDFPELQEIRAVLTSHFGKEFAARAIELRNNCGVNHAVCSHFIIFMKFSFLLLMYLHSILTKSE